MATVATVMMIVVLVDILAGALFCKQGQSRDESPAQHASAVPISPDRDEKEMP